MARARFPGHFGVGQKEALDSLLGRVLLIIPSSTEELLQCVHSLEAGIIESNARLVSLEAGIIESKARLVVVDSVAAVARADFGGAGWQNTANRNKALGQLAAQLKHLAETFRIPVIVTNQLVFELVLVLVLERLQQQQQGQSKSKGTLTAALGTMWAHNVNVRLILERSGEHRYLRVAKSPASANIALQYEITSKGVEEVEGALVPPLPPQSLINYAITNDMDFAMG
eukprot:gene6745-3418_t